MTKLIRNRVWWCSQLTMLALILLTCQSAFAQDTKISGKVTSSNGDALPGVTILVKGTTNGTISDINGAYAISVPSRESVLEFSFIGMKSQEVTVGGRLTIDVMMEEDIESLKEVVVTGYTTQSREKVTSSIATVDTKQALKLPVANATEALQGRVTGVTVVSGAQPGDAPLVRIRGYGSTGNNDPLYIVDGVQLPSSGAIRAINSKDIKEITVLKDAAAASIYGARASNGVIVITTKMGSVTKKPTLTMDAYYGIQMPTNLPDMVSSQQLGDLLLTADRNDGGSTDFIHFPSGQLTDYLSGNPDNPYDFDNNRTTRASDGTDWFEEIFDPARIQNYYISATGGSEAGRYMMSAGYFDQEGIIHGTGFELFNSRVNTEFNIGKKARVGQHTNVAYGVQKPIPSQYNDENPISLAYRASPLIPVYDEGGNYAGSGAANQLGNAVNPFAKLDRAKIAGDKNRTFAVFSDGFLEYDILDNLTAKTSLGVTYVAGKNNDFNALNPEHSEPISINRLTEKDFISTSYVWTNTLKYDIKVNDVHDFGILLGTEAIRSNSRQTAVFQENFQYEHEDFLVISAGTGSTGIDADRDETFNVESSLYSLFGRFDYEYDGKYLASFTLRNDRTSRFNSGQNSGVFPAVGLGWILSEESFLAVSPISFLKLRGSWGQMGNQSIPTANPNVTISTFNDQNSFYSFDGSSHSAGISTAAVGNPNLTWETSDQWDIGIDLGLMDNRLKLTADYYAITTQDMILAPPLPSTSTIADAPFANVGEMSNKGFEFELGYSSGVTNSDFRYNIVLNVSTYDNEVTKINAGENTFFVGESLRSNTVSRTQAGQPLSSFYGREVIGIFQTETEVSNSPDQGFATPADGVGRFKYADTNGDNVINDDDRTFIGSPHPDFTYGIDVVLEYKNFDLSLFFSGSQGNEIYNYTKFFTDFPSFPNGGRSTRALDAWSEDNTGGSIPKLSNNFTTSNFENAPNSYFVEDGSFFRLKNLQVGYNLPKDLVSRAGISSARFYAQATNLFTLTGYDGIDPEIGSIQTGSNQNINLGVDQGTFPLARTYTVGVTVEF
ncbi:SusC/RagA family TonB-linked outer membrane protein [Reichenbachiella versicolor]|uniref:SusC/RagA family TonB-linked outer membrane protein n=1 Tax=Reichenbachiella versicolor TaxID=1821036 RepID=UPI000D6E5E86|nr:TonB-dependent receptor [Reichenbachiella versicolor]